VLPKRQVETVQRRNEGALRTQETRLVLHGYVIRHNPNPLGVCRESPHFRPCAKTMPLSPINAKSWKHCTVNELIEGTVTSSACAWLNSGGV
jgi:hypothetical protein